MIPLNDYLSVPVNQSQGCDPLNYTVHVGFSPESTNQSPPPRPSTALCVPLLLYQVLECLRLNSPVETIVTRRRGEVSPLSTVDRRVSAATRYGLSVGEKDEGLPPVTSNGSATATGQVAVEEVSISLTDTVARGESGGIQADAAVVTVPLSLLQKGIITFDPPLPEVRRFCRFERFSVVFLSRQRLVGSYTKFDNYR